MLAEAPVCSLETHAGLLKRSRDAHVRVRGSKSSRHLPNPVAVLLHYLAGSDFPETSHASNATQTSTAPTAATNTSVCADHRLAENRLPNAEASCLGYRPVPIAACLYSTLL
jgi:hypothetical protein